MVIVKFELPINFYAMILIFKKDDLLWSLFPNIDPNDENSILSGLEEYYTYDKIKPIITIDNDVIKVNLDTERLEIEENQYNEAIRFCNTQNYKKAKPILEKLLKQNKTNSDYYRVYGQILSEEGNQEEAINYLIDALKWNPKNSYALIMMGNIYMKYKKDLETALKYYNSSLYLNPKDYLTLNNIAVILMQQGNKTGAKSYLEHAYEIESSYPNTIYALAMIYEQEGEYLKAFDKCIEVFKVNQNKNDSITVNTLNLVLDICKKLTDEKKLLNEVLGYKLELEERCEKDIEIIVDNSIKTAAKIEYAELHNRKEHVIKYNDGYPAFNHLVLHELVHLDFALDARDEGKQQIFLVNPEQRNEYIAKHKGNLKQLEKLGYNENRIVDHISFLMDGINNQVFNAPIDLFIEDKIYKLFNEIRPFQFYSMYTFLQQGIKGVTEKNIEKVVPSDIISMNKIYNLLQAFQFKEFYNIDLISKFKANAKEYKTASKFYSEYSKLNDDKEPGVEYNLIVNWANELNWMKNFELINEDDYYKNRVDIENIVSEFESFEENNLKPNLQKEKEMKTFLETQKEIGLNMAVVMFMVDALNYFNGIDKEKTKKIAFEIAMQGTQGYSPEKDNYMISQIPGKKFSGYNILAYYYVSFSLVLPELLKELQLPYDKEYELALKLFQKK